jgi:hypothetical protein
MNKNIINRIKTLLVFIVAMGLSNLLLTLMIKGNNIGVADWLLQPLLGITQGYIGLIIAAYFSVNISNNKDKTQNIIKIFSITLVALWLLLSTFSVALVILTGLWSYDFIFEFFVSLGSYFAYRKLKDKDILSL